MHAFCGWFDTQFRGSDGSPADTPVTLSTAPDPTGATHWGQQSFYIVPPLECAPGDKLKATIKVRTRAWAGRAGCRGNWGAWDGAQGGGASSSCARPTAVPVSVRACGGAATAGMRAPTAGRRCARAG